MPFAISTMLILCLAVPVGMVAAVLQDRATFLLALGIAGLASLVGVPEGVRAWRGLLRPHASPRWLHAVRGVVGDDVMVEAISALQLQHRRDPDYAIRRTDVIEQVQVARNRRREQRKRLRGVRLSGPGSLS